MIWRFPFFLAFVSLASSSREDNADDPKIPDISLRNQALPSYKFLENLPMKRFDFSKLPMQPSPETLRSYLAEQLNGERPRPPPKKPEPKLLPSERLIPLVPVTAIEPKSYPLVRPVVPVPIQTQEQNEEQNHPEQNEIAQEERKIVKVPPQIQVSKPVPIERSAVPAPPQMEELKNLEALRSLKYIRHHQSVQGYPPHMQRAMGESNLAEDIGRLLAGLMSSTMTPEKKEELVPQEVKKTEAQEKKQEKAPEKVETSNKYPPQVPPQVCIQFIDLSPKALDYLHGKHKYMSSYLPTYKEHSQSRQSADRITENTKANEAKDTSIRSETRPIKDSDKKLSQKLNAFTQ